MKLTNHINKIAFTESNRDPMTWDLTSVKQINFFIGPNNSGKSRKVRQFFLLKKDKIIFDTDLFSVQQCLDHWKSAFTPDQKTSIIHHTRRHLIDFISAIESIIESNRPIGIYQLNQAILENVYGSNHNRVNSIENHLIEPVKRSNKSGHVVLDKINQIRNWHSVYIPTLRSLRNIHDTDAFHQRTTTDYFSNLPLKEMIFTGHTLYDDVKAHLLGSHEEREKVRKYEKYLSKNFFFGQDIALVPRIDTDVVYFKEGDKEERPIYDLGDGIQSIIMLTYPIFMATKPTMFFIEEPELYLHAGLQRTLVETYANHKEHMFYITTHSNHFLDIAQERDDVSIQKVRQNEDGETEVTPAAEFEELLTELGVRASSVLLANCSIWVEGITDKLYLRTYLNKYIEELREKGYEQKANQLSSYHENLHFVFTEYQGSNITHWYFGESNSGEHINSTPARKLNHKILLIADADIDGKGDRVEMLKQDLGDSFILLDWKEIENYIPQEIIIKTAEARWNTFNGIGESTNSFQNIPKNRFEKKDEGIGTILERFVQKKSLQDPERKLYSEKSGTIKDKVKFCHTAIEIMNSDDTDWKLTPKLTKLCERIWAHVIDSNK
ncbi:AAA family ATPase [Vibrio sp. Vb1166]|uniref:AAA family ATPase n=1 Tax=Vibrio TaxID=662 RepID=UPI001A8C09BA|nr:MULTISPECIES: AAA family ATPase [Vibrio]MBO0204401.1 AAA family ATPase [Vibrio alginolyticus]MDW1519931.1 AAA family ATPase [Vibrio sp. Vb5032]MDW1860469.1 AAA family ATPase [Vibrio sp. Vb1166]